MTPQSRRIRADVPAPGVVSARKLLLAAYLLTAAAYFSWRVTILNLDQLAVSLAFVVAELVGFLWSLNLIGWSVEFNHRDTFEIQLRAGKDSRRSGGALRWSDAAERDRFDYALHVNRIAFLARFDGADRQTRLSWLAGLLAPGSRDVASTVRPSYTAISILLAAGLAFGSTTVHGQQAIPLTGIDTGMHSLYGYGGAIATVGGNFGESGPVARLWVDYLEYDFLVEDETIDAWSNGTSASLGYRWVRTGGSFALYGGIDVRDTRFSQPLDRPNEGLKTGVRVQSEISQRLAKRTMLDGIASFVKATDDYWLRASLSHQLTDRITAGPEVTGQGSPTYTSARIGGHLSGLPVVGRIRMNVNAGVEKSADRKASPYLSIGFAM